MEITKRLVIVLDFYEELGWMGDVLGVDDLSQGESEQVEELLYEIVSRLDGSGDVVEGNG